MIAKIVIRAVTAIFTVMAFIHMGIVIIGVLLRR